MGELHAVAVFQYDERLKGKRKAWAVFKAKMLMVLRRPMLPFNSRFEVKDVPPTTFEFGVIVVKWKKGGQGRWHGKIYQI